MLKVRIYVKNYENEYGIKKVTKAYLYLDLGYTKKILSWDMNLCAEVLQISLHQLYCMECGEYQVC